MKKIISILMCILAVAVIGIRICQESNTQILTYGNLEKEYCETFMIPDEDEICNPEILFWTLTETAQMCSANIIKTRLIDGENSGDYELVKYILVGSENSLYLQQFDLQDGRMLTSADTSDLDFDGFVSTKDYETESQIGWIGSNMLNMDVTVYPLARIFDYSKADGLYYVELAGKSTMENFLQTLHDNIQKYTGVDIDVSELYGAQSTVGIPYADLTQYYIVFGFICILFALFVLYYLFRKRRDAAIMRLMGTKNSIICKELFFEPLAVFPVFGLLAALAIWMFSGSFWYSVKVTYCIWLLYDACIVFFVLAYRMANRNLAYSAALKGQQFTRGILAIHMIAEALCLLFVLYAGAGAYTNIISLGQDMKRYENWSIAEDYGVFYPLYTGDDQTSDEQDERDIAIGGALYTELNERGALFVDATEFEDEYQELNAQYVTNTWEYSLKVNPNYLEAFQVLDENGQQIEVSEEEESLVLLVPENYKDEEEAILRYYLADQTSYREVDTDIYGLETTVSETQQIKIIWTKTDQQVFTFDSSVSMDVAGITDPVIVVLTENNSYVCQRLGVLGSGNSDPLKVKLSGTSKETYDELYEVLDELGLSDNLKALVSVNEQANETLALMKANLILAVRLILVMLLLLVYLIYQSTVLIFEGRKKEYAVKQLFGLHPIRIWGKGCMCAAGILLLVVLIYALFIGYGGAIYILMAAAAITALQLITMYLCISRQLRMKRSDILKGV